MQANNINTIPNLAEYDFLKNEQLSNSRTELINKLADSSLKKSKLELDIIDIEQKIKDSSITGIKKVKWSEIQKEINFYERNIKNNQSDYAKDILKTKYSDFLRNIKKYNLLKNELNLKNKEILIIKKKLKQLKNTSYTLNIYRENNNTYSNLTGLKNDVKLPETIQPDNQLIILGKKFGILNKFNFYDKNPHYTIYHNNESFEIIYKKTTINRIKKQTSNELRKIINFNKNLIKTNKFDYEIAKKVITVNIAKNELKRRGEYINTNEYIKPLSYATINTLVGASLKTNKWGKTDAINSIAKKYGISIKNLETAKGQQEFRNALAKYSKEHNLAPDIKGKEKIGPKIYFELFLGKKLIDIKNNFRDTKKQQEYIISILNYNKNKIRINESKNTKDLIKFIEENSDISFRKKVEKLGYNIDTTTVNKKPTESKENNEYSEDKLENINGKTQGRLITLINKYSLGVDGIKYTDIIDDITGKEKLDEAGVNLIKGIQESNAGINIYVPENEKGIIDEKTILKIASLPTKTSITKDLINTLFYITPEIKESLLKALKGEKIDETKLNDFGKKFLKSIKKSVKFKEEYEKEKPRTFNSVEEYNKLSSSEKNGIIERTRKELSSNGVNVNRFVKFISKHYLGLPNSDGTINDDFIRKILEKQLDTNSHFYLLANTFGANNKILRTDAIIGEYTTLFGLALDNKGQKQELLKDFIGTHRNKNVLKYYKKIKNKEHLTEQELNELRKIQNAENRPTDLSYKILKIVIEELREKENPNTYEEKFLKDFDKKEKIIIKKYEESEQYVKDQLDSLNMAQTLSTGLREKMEKGDKAGVMTELGKLAPEIAIIGLLLWGIFSNTEGSLWKSILGIGVVGIATELLGDKAGDLWRGLSEKLFKKGDGNGEGNGADDNHNYTPPSDEQKKAIETKTENNTELEGFEKKYEERMGKHSKYYQSSFEILKDHYKGLDKKEANKYFVSLSKNETFKTTPINKINNDIKILEKGDKKAKDLLKKDTYKTLGNNPKKAALFLKSLLAANEKAEIGLDLFTGGPDAKESFSRFIDNIGEWFNEKFNNLNNEPNINFIEGYNEINLDSLKNVNGKSKIDNLENADKSIIAFLTLKIASNYKGSNSGKTIKELIKNKTIKINEDKEIEIINPEKFNNLIKLWKTQISTQYKAYIKQAKTADEIIKRITDPELKKVLKKAKEEGKIKETIKKLKETDSDNKSFWESVGDILSETGTAISTAAAGVVGVIKEAFGSDNTAKDRTLIINSEINGYLEDKNDLIQKNNELIEKFKKNGSIDNDIKKLEKEYKKTNVDRRLEIRKEIKELKQEKLKLREKFTQNRKKIEEIEKQITEKSKEVRKNKEIKKKVENEISLLLTELDTFSSPYKLEELSDNSKNTAGILDHYQKIITVYGKGNKLKGFSDLNIEINKINDIINSNINTFLSKNIFNITKEDAENLNKVQEILKESVDYKNANHLDKVFEKIQNKYDRYFEKVISEIKDKKTENISNKKELFNKYTQIESIFDELDLNDNKFEEYEKELKDKNIIGLINTVSNAADTVVSTVTNKASSVGDTVSESGDDLGKKIDELLVKAGLKKGTPMYEELYNDLKDDFDNVKDITKERFQEIIDNYDNKKQDYIKKIIEILN